MTSSFVPSHVVLTSIRLCWSAQFEQGLVPEGNSPFSQWLSMTNELLKKPHTASVVVDALFLRMVHEDQWSSVLLEFDRASAAGHVPSEWHIDLKNMDPSWIDHTSQRLHALIDSCKKPQSGHIRTVIVSGLKSRYGRILSALPFTLLDLKLNFQEELMVDHGDEGSETFEAEERAWRQRVEAMFLQYVKPHISLTSVCVKYDEFAEDHLPLSARALIALLQCPGLLKIELERCALSSSGNDNDNTVSGEDQDTSNDNTDEAVYQALASNVSLFLLRMRSGSIEQGLGESIARAIEVENRTLKYLDMGDMNLSEPVVSVVTKAILRNPTIQGVELNLNSIEQFHFQSLGNMTCMDISDNFLGDEGALQLAQLIPACRLERINLADNCIGHIGGCALAWSFMHNNTLSKINICNNPLLDPDAGDGPTSDVTRRIYDSFKDTPAYKQGFLGMLCSSLRYNTEMSFINLANTGVDDSHGPLLAILFRVSNIDGIGLLRNNIGDNCCIYMCQALAKYQTSLKVLMLEMNPISAHGYYALWKGALAANDTLISVTVGKQVYEIDGIERGQRDLDIVLRMNRAGLVRLRRNKNATREQWVEALIELSDDMDCSYSFLIENPLLIRS